MKALTKLTMEDIRSWNPCSDPNRYLPEDWSGTAIDLLSNDKIPFESVLWVICHHGVADSGILRRFAAWCAADSMFVTRQADQRAWNAVEVSIKFSLDQASDSELLAAHKSSSFAAMDAGWKGGCLAAWGASGPNAGKGLRQAAWDAAESAVTDAGKDSVRSAQRKKLLSMLKEESDFTLSNLLNDYPIERT